MTMKKTTVILLVSILGVVLAGCGGGEASDPMTLLVDSAEAMSQVSGYRIHGSISLEELDAQGNSAGDPLTMEVNGQVQIVDGVAHQYLLATMGAYKSEAYIIGRDYYQFVTGTGWMHMSVEAATSQNPSINVMDAQKMGVIGEMAESSEIIEEDKQQVGLLFRLGEEFFRTSLETYLQQLEEAGNPMGEEERKEIEDSLSQIQAEMSIWINKENKLINTVQMDFVMGGEAMGGSVRNASLFDFFDYNATDIVVELPEEAKQAKEFDFTSE
jgi:hypothetical protein